MPGLIPPPTPAPTPSPAPAPTSNATSTLTPTPICLFVCLSACFQSGEGQNRGELTAGGAASVDSFCSEPFGSDRFVIFCVCFFLIMFCPLLYIFV